MMIEIIMFLMLLGIIFFAINQHHEKVTLSESLIIQKEKQKKLKENLGELLHENLRLSKETVTSSELLNRMQKEAINTVTGEEVNSEYIGVVKKLFGANLNFTPKNYEDRKKEVSSYLSDELNKKYFGQRRNTYQDANGTTSQLLSLEAYTKNIQEKNIEGLVIVNYKSKQDNKEWVKGVNIFKVTYDKESKKIIKIYNLGSGYSKEVTG